MLWSDRTREPSPEVRQVQAMVRRAAIVMAVAVVVLMALVGLG